MRQVGPSVGRAFPRVRAKGKGGTLKEKRWKVMNDRAISYGAGGCPTLWPRRHCSRMLQLPVDDLPFRPFPRDRRRSCRPVSDACGFCVCRVKNAPPPVTPVKARRCSSENRWLHSCLTFFIPCTTYVYTLVAKLGPRTDKFSDNVRRRKRKMRETNSLFRVYIKG